MIISRPTPVSFLDRSISETQNYYAMAGILSDGSVFCWGNSAYGGALPAGATVLLNGTVDAVQIFSSATGFAAIREDGSLVSWGEWGLVTPISNSALDGTVDVVTVASTQTAFAALRADGSVVSWGVVFPGGEPVVHERVASELDGTTPVREICTTQYDFAALREDGSIVVWGRSGDNFEVYNFPPDQLPVSVFTNGAELAILLADGSVSMVYHNELFPVAGLDGSVQVQKIYANYFSFAALLTDGSVVTWGGDVRAPGYGGSIPVELQASLASGVVSITQTLTGYCALKSDGTLVAWGDYAGFLFGEGPVDANIPVLADPNARFMAVSSNYQSYVALDSNGKLHAWGNAYYGGALGDTADPESVAARLSDKTIVKVYSNSVGYAALADDGTVISWGGNAQGPTDPDGQYVGLLEASYDQVEASLTDPANPVIEVISNYAGFVAVKADGSFVTWGAIDKTNPAYTPPAIDGNVAVFANYLSEDIILCGTMSGDVITADDSDTTCLGYDGNDTITGGRGEDVLIGGSGADGLTGGAGMDTLVGGDGNDTVNAGGGNDVIVGGNGAGNDIYRGGLGIDTVKYTSALAGITVDLGAGSATSTAGADAARIGTDQLSAIENIIAGNFADRLVGSGVANRIEGLAGNDQINGRGGNDTLIGGGGNDTLLGGTGNDKLTGGLGSDTASYFGATSGVTVSLAVTSAQDTDGAGKDTLSAIENLFGSGLGDQLTGNFAANTLIGSGGDDTLVGNGGNDKLQGGEGKDFMTGGFGADSFVFDDGEFGGDTQSVADVILDFSHAQGDRIALSLADANTANGTADDAFTFIGSAAFSGLAGELRYAFAGGDTLISGDTNGDGTGDFLIVLTGAQSLVAADFAL